MATATEAPIAEPRTEFQRAGHGGRDRRARATASASSRCSSGSSSRSPRGEVVGARRPLRLRQVDAARADRRAARAERRHDRASAGASRPRERLARCAYMPQRDLLLPWLSALDNAALAPRNRGASRDRGPRARPRRCSSASASAGSSARGRRSSRAGCASGSPSCARCSPASRCCCSTSRSPRSTRSRAPRCRSGWRARWRREPAHGRPRHPRRRGGALPLRPGAGALRRARAAIAGRRSSSPRPRGDAAARGGHRARVRRLPASGRCAALAGGERRASRLPERLAPAAARRRRRPARALGAGRALGRARRRAQHRAVPDPGAERDRASRSGTTASCSPRTPG